jgi:hypothetical protein
VAIPVRSFFLNFTSAGAPANRGESTAGTASPTDEGGSIAGIPDGAEQLERNPAKALP